MRIMTLALALALSGCSSQFALGPAAWTATPPVIPGFTPIPLGNGGFIEEPNSALQPPPTATPEQTTLAALQEAQQMREAIRRLAR